MEFYQQGGDFYIKGNEYELLLAQANHPRALLKLRGAPVAELLLSASCDADGQRDMLLGVEAPRVRADASGVVVELETRSSLWPRKTLVLECRSDRLEFYCRLYGQGALDNCLLLAGSTGPDHMEMSTPYFTRLFNPEPNADRKQYSSPSEAALIGVRSDRSHRCGNWFFTPAPFCYCLQLASDDWLSVGLLASPDALSFVSYEFVAGTGFGLRIAYEGLTDVAGAWESPRLLFQAGNDEYEALADYCNYLFRHGAATTSRAEQYDWWSEPIFCGWGQQMNMAAKLYYDGGDLASRAAGFATQNGYERFIDRIEARGIVPGMVVIDDKWQAQYGLNWPDPAKWPFMEPFVACQHELGRKVLLWLKAWDPEGVPAEECLLDEDGKAIAVDPGHLGFERRLRAQVRAMLRELDVDGFKIDFTHKLPAGKLSRKPAGGWGTGLLKRYLRTIYDEAKQSKPDTLIMAHTANPYFADVVDMIRLNDVANVAGDESYLASMRHRARVARAAAPHWLIDTDNWPSPSKLAWREYVEAQPALGVPSLYYVSGISYLKSNGQLNEEEFDESDYKAIASTWERYRRNRC